MELFVRPNNPKIFTVEQKQKMAMANLQQVRALTASMKEAGHNGSAVIFSDGTVEVAVFDAAGLKSAVNNSGVVDPTHSDIRFSCSLGSAMGAGLNNVSDVKLPAGYLVGDLLNSSGKLN